MTRQRNTRLGEQINYLVRRLATEKGWTMTRTVAEIAAQTGYSEATVHRWRQGRLCPEDKTLETLACMGKEEANLDREWGERLFKAAGYPDVKAAVDKIWGPQALRHIPNNLPPREHTRFIGRQAELARLLELLSPHHAAHLVTVDGIAGVGKTALVLEAAYRCLQASRGEIQNPRVPTFEAIIFVSAKQHYLTPEGLLARRQAQRTLKDLFHEVARTLDRHDILQALPEEQPRRVRDALARQRTLLIVDNLETVEDREAILSFLYDLPPSVKVIITSRERVLYVPIRLEQLPETEGLDLIYHQAQEKQVVLDEQQARALYRRTGGIPAAIVYAIGQIAAGHTVDAVLERIAQAHGDVARFCFEGAVAPLRGAPEHHLLMAIAMFPKRPLREAAMYVAGLDKDPLVADEAQARLRQLSLITYREGRYSMLPLTREYALAELAAHPQFEREARERWVQWYRDFVDRYGGYEWQEWHLNYDKLEEEWDNILAVYEWCALNDRYEDIQFFQSYRGIHSFLSIYGHWDDILSWETWLIEAAERRGDWPAVVESLHRQAWILALMGTPTSIERAKTLLLRAMQLSAHATTSGRAAVARDWVVVCWREGKYEEALRWLDKFEDELTAAGDDPDLPREEVSALYWRGVILFALGDLDKARKVFEEVSARGQEIGWQRAVIYAQNWLADIAIHRGQLDEAEHLLRTGLPVAERNKDKRRAAFYQRSFALLEHKRGNREAARRWAEAALDGFERLGMQPEAKEMEALLATLGEHQS